MLLRLYFILFYVRNKVESTCPKLEQYNSTLSDLVLVAGLEPARYLYRRILSPLRLPIPPHERINMKFYSMNTSNNKKKTLRSLQAQSFLEAPPGFEPGDKGFADLGLTTWL